MQGFQEFLEHGGQLELSDLTPRLLREPLRRGIPILSGLSATFLYREARERPEDEQPDPIAGHPAGHFVVLSGYRVGRGEVLVTDPLHPNPLSVRHTYPVPIQRVVGAIDLGVLTHDANLLLLDPPKPRRKSA